MGRYIYILIAFLLFLGCEPVNKQSDGSAIRIDTLEKGTYGNTSYSLIIKTMLDTVEIESHHKYFDDYGQLISQNYYNDSFGTKRYFHYVGPFIYKGELNISHSWYDKRRLSIISADTLFVKTKLKKIEYCVYKEEQHGYDKLLLTFEREYNRGRVLRTTIQDYDLHTMYVEQNGKFYEMETDLPAKYLEWTSSSKTAFGHAIIRFKEIFLTAMVTRIEDKYLQLAKEKNNVDLNLALDNLF